jgi:hypothetical protein
MRILITAATALPLLLTSLTFSLAPTAPAYALPTNSSCLVTTYFKTSALEDEVGKRTQCTGSPMTMTGHATPWHTSERFSTCAGGTGHPHGGSQGLPCEFLAAGCSNLPVNRFSNG